MAKENRSKYAILGLLSWGPMSGYGIKKAVEQSISNFWNESYGQIYPILKRLAAEGLAATSVEKQAGKPERYVYTLTEKGRKALQAWLRRPVVQEVGRVEILLKLFFGRQVAVADNIRHLQRFQTRQRQLLKKYEAIEARLRADYADNPDLPYWLMTLSYGRHCSQALLHWADETLVALQVLADRPPTAHP
jgi:PadR family transcriptional regulator AphA